MKKSAKPRETGGEDIRAEYDFSKGVRGKHASRYWEGSNIVALAPDVARVFKNSDAVNAALRDLIEIAGKAAKGRKRSGAA
jgi:hypothetical protein